MTVSAITVTSLRKLLLCVRRYQKSVLIHKYLPSDTCHPDTVVLCQDLCLLSASKEAYFILTASKTRVENSTERHKCIQGPKEAHASVLRSNVPLARSAGACNRLYDLLIATGDTALACVTVCCTGQSALTLCRRHIRIFSTNTSLTN